MPTNLFAQRHRDEVMFELSCFDRVIITGSLPDICHARAMAGLLSYQGIRLFDYPRWAEPLRNQVRSHAEQLAKAAGIEIEFIRKHGAFRKEARIKAILAKRGEHPGLVHIFSAMEPCNSYRPWHDKATGKTSLKPTSGKCLHYYFYFIDADFGLCYVRVPTWSPFRLQVYFNGHHWLARQLEREDIAYHMADNAFVSLADPERAQQLADSLNAKAMHHRLDRWATDFCPVASQFRSGYHWSLMQVEFATDVVFRRQTVFQPLYQSIVRTAVHEVQADQVARFLGRKLNGHYQDELGNDFSTRIQGTRIRHHMGQTSIKLYDKAAIMARVECTTNNPSFFKIHRQVEQRNGERVWKLAPLRKSLYSLADLRKLMRAANLRYFAFMAAMDNPHAGLRDIDKLSSPAQTKGRSFRGFNLFQQTDWHVFITLTRGEWAISGFRNADLRHHLPDCSPSQTSYLIKRLRTHGLIKKIGHRYKYYLTQFGQRVISTVLAIRERAVIPTLCAAQ
jgi:hypothetical protein